MSIYTKLENHVKRRPAELVKMKKEGTKIVGYIPEGYFPEELVYAAGAIPAAFGKGGSYEMVADSLRYVTRFLCTWCRTQIAYKMSGDIWYNLPELLFIPTTDCNVKSIGDMFSYWSDVETVYYGVPHNKLPEAVDYYNEALKRVSRKLEAYTGNKITNERLKLEIDKQNKIRTLLNDISELRKAEYSPISGYEFMKLQHYSMQSDPDFLIECLEEIYAELKVMKVESSDKIRLYLTGSTLAFGDYGLYEIAEQAGAEIVCEDFAGGVRNILNNVVCTGDDVFSDLTDAYFTKRREGAWFRPSSHRVDYLVDDIKNYNCEGVIWYEMLYRESYDMQAFYFDQIIKDQTGAPMVKIESDYDASEKGNIKTRVETLVEIVIGGRL